MVVCSDLRGGRLFILVAGSLVCFIVTVLYVKQHEKTMESTFESTVKSLSHKMTVPNPPQTQPLDVWNEVKVNPVPSEADLKAMGVGPLSDFFHGYVHSTQALCNRVLRMGRIGDGGWDICDDPLYKPDKKNCLVYSVGINNDFCYDDAMEKYGCEVHSYDPSMKATDHLRGEKIHFHQVGISGKNIKKQPGKWALFTLATLRQQNGHSPEKRRVDIVKMDVEGAEYDSLLAAIHEGSLKDVRQLSFEIHLSDSASDPNKNQVTKMLTILRRLWDLGFRVYKTTRNSVRGNLYTSKIHGVQRTRCTEVNMVNVNIRPGN